MSASYARGEQYRVERHAVDPEIRRTLIECYVAQLMGRTAMPSDRQVETLWRIIDLPVKGR